MSQDERKQSPGELQKQLAETRQRLAESDAEKQQLTQIINRRKEKNRKSAKKSRDNAKREVEALKYQNECYLQQLSLNPYSSPFVNGSNHDQQGSEIVQLRLSASKDIKDTVAVGSHCIKDAIKESIAIGTNSIQEIIRDANNKVMENVDKGQQGLMAL